MKRRTAAILVVVTVVVAALAGWIAGATLQSPEEAAARTAPPEASAILAPVEERALSTDVVARGTAGYGTPRELSLAPSTLKGGPGVVTRQPRPGASIREGQVLVEVDGRPVFALEGDTPSYRDLGPGMSGADVLQLEAALGRIGLSPGAIDGRYDAATERAVEHLYRLAGTEPLRATQVDIDANRPAAATFDPTARARAGVQLPADEAVFVTSLPIRVEGTAVGLGQEVASPLLTVTDAVVTVRAELPLEEAGLVEFGMPTRVDEASLGVEADGVIVHVAEQPGTRGSDQFHVAFEVAVTDPPPGVVGASVRVTVPVESVDGPVLAVPVSALFLAGDGTSRLEVDRDGTIETVAVEPGLAAAGFVEITPVEGTVEPGDMVVVGTQNGSAGA